MNRHHLFQGQHRTLREIAAMTGKPHGTLHDRVHRQGMTLEDALTCPRKPTGRRKAAVFLFEGEPLTVAQIAERTGKHVCTIYRRRLGNRILSQEELHDPHAEPPVTARLITFGSRTLTLSAWARLTGMDPVTIAQRINRGWPVPRALTTPPATKAPVLRRRAIARMVRAFRITRNRPVITRMVQGFHRQQAMEVWG